MMNDFILIVLQNIETFSLAMFGVGITVFTVVYSFIVSKRAYYKSIIESQKHQDTTSTYLEAEIHFAVIYMDKLKKLNIFVLVFSLVSLALYILSLATYLNDVRAEYLGRCYYVIFAIISIYLLGILALFGYYIVGYFKEVKY